MRGGKTNGGESNECKSNDCIGNQKPISNIETEAVPEPFLGRDMSPGIPCVKPAAQRFPLDSDSDSDEDNSLESPAEIVSPVPLFSDDQESRDDEVKSAYSDEPLDSASSDSDVSTTLCSSHCSDDDWVGIMKYRVKEIVKAPEGKLTVRPVKWPHRPRGSESQGAESGNEATVEHVERALLPGTCSLDDPMSSKRVAVDGEIPPPPAPLPAWLERPFRPMHSSPRPEEDKGKEKMRKGKEKMEKTEEKGLIVAPRQSKRDMEASRKTDRWLSSLRATATTSLSLPEPEQRQEGGPSRTMTNGEHDTHKEQSDRKEKALLVSRCQVGGLIGAERSSFTAALQDPSSSSVVPQKRRVPQPLYDEK